MYKLTSTIICNDKININKKILLFSDIHYTGLKDKKKLIRLFNKIKEYDEEYDINFICIPGDTLENVKMKDDYFLVDWLKDLSTIATIIISLGNHDLKIKRKNKKNYFHNDKYWDKIKNIDNLYLLSNEGILIDDLYFYGYTQSYDYYYGERGTESEKLMLTEIEKYNVCNPKGIVNILLVHSPMLLTNKKISEKLKKYDLIFSGHMHNGMVPPILDEIIKNNKGIISPRNRMIPNCARGIIKGDNTTVIISSGITKISKLIALPIRIFNFIYPVGINYVEITNDKNKKNSIKYSK